MYKKNRKNELLIRSGMLYPLEKRPVGACDGMSMPYGGASARADVSKKLLLPLSTKESPNTKKARGLSGCGCGACASTKFGVFVTVTTNIVTNNMLIA